MSIKNNRTNSKAKNGKKKQYKFIKKGKGNEPTVIEFNLSKAVILLIAIGVIVATIATVKVISTIVGAQENKALAGDEETNVTWVESTHVAEDGSTVVDVDDEGNPIKIPVPKGYSASKIPGETSANSGFVIYEGDIDWSTILVGTTSQNSIDTQSDLNEEINTNETTTQSSQENASNVITQNENVSSDNVISSENDEDSKNNEITQSESMIQEQDTETNSTNNNEQEPIVTEENTSFTGTEETENAENLNKDTTNIEDETKTEIDNVVENEEKTKLVENTDSENEIILEENSIENSAEENSIQESTEEIVDENSGAEVLNSQIEDNSVEVLADETTDINNTSPESRATTEEINIFNLQKSVNQYVWVPVKDPTRIYGVDSNGMIWGKLYNFPATATGSRTPLNWTETDGVMSIIDKNLNLEPGVSSPILDDVNFEYSGDIDSSLQSKFNGKTRYELLSKELEENFYKTIKSIKEYGGFYIGRYETGGLSGTAVVRKMEEDIGNQTWYTMYEKAKTLKGQNDTVFTSMIWGSLWDETLQWLVDSGATISDGTALTYDLIGSYSAIWGNYSDSTFHYISSGSETPDETAEKVVGSYTRIPTGSSEYTKVNNIYDLAGNVMEDTLELCNDPDRYTRRRQGQSWWALHLLQPRAGGLPLQRYSDV